MPILQKLGVNEVGWADNVNHFDRRFYHVVGAVDAMRQYSEKIGQWWCRVWGVQEHYMLEFDLLKAY